MTYYERNREKCLKYAREYSKEYLSKNIEAFRQYRAMYYRQNLESIKRSSKLYYLANKEKYIERSLEQRRRKRKTPYDRFQNYYLKCLMKLPDVFKKQRRINKKKKVIKASLDMTLTIYFD